VQPVRLGPLLGLQACSLPHQLEQLMLEVLQA
jgi:hypothetical protein